MSSASNSPVSAHPGGMDALMRPFGVVGAEAAVAAENIEAIAKICIEIVVSKAAMVPRGKRRVRARTLFASIVLDCWTALCHLGCVRLGVLQRSIGLVSSLSCSFCK